MWSACLVAVLGGAGLQADPPPTYAERWRPQYHFTPPDTWMNDPNGMVYYDGEYHLFYQNNPFGNRWGHMSWGHAVSKDLVHWENLPLALAEENGVMIFSGSAVVDWNNTSGFGRDGKPPMVAIYTGHHTGKPLQNQQIAYSTDRGRTWTKYSGNPVLDIGEADFRDPKVIWHQPTGRWVIAVSWPHHRQVRFYASPDLKSWTHLSDFGPAGSTSGIWECPDLFPIRVEGQRGNRWVLVVNVGSGAPAGGSGTQYFVGDFDGTRFVPDPASTPKPQPEWVPTGTVLADFENGYGDWQTTGDAFGSGPATGTWDGQQAVAGFEGRGLVNTFRGGDGAQGTLTSPLFRVDQDYLSFRIGGGRLPDQVGVNLWVNDRIVRSATGADAERLVWQSWDVREFRGQQARLELVDRATGGWGHLNADHFILAAAPARNATEAALWADFGRDFYAAVTWSDVPPRDGRRLWLGWMSNWNYANDVPTFPWRSAMTVPRVLTLRSTPAGLRLAQSPVEELEELRETRHQLKRVKLDRAAAWMETLNFPAGLVEVELDLERVPTSGTVALTFQHGTTGSTVIRADLAGSTMQVDRTRSGRGDFHPAFPGVHTAPLRVDEGRLRLRVLVDVSSVEVFAQDGETVLTDLILPATSDLRVGLSAEGAARSIEIRSASLWALRAAPPLNKTSLP